jgi:hypothetical protein
VANDDFAGLNVVRSDQDVSDLLGKWGDRPQQSQSAPTVGDAIQAAAAQYGLNPAVLKGIAHIESSWDPSSNKDKTTQYKGLFQLGGDEWKQHGSGDIYNAQDNANAAAKLLSSHAQWFQNSYGREPTPGELYMMHLQGRGFISKGTMTNVAGNPYPGMRGPQTPESFQKGWSDTLARRMAPYGGGDSIYGEGGPPAAAAATNIPASGVLGTVPGLFSAPPSGSLPAPPGYPAQPAVPGPNTVTAAAKPPGLLNEADKAKIDAAKKALAESEDKNSNKLASLANQLMSASQQKPAFNPVQLAQVNTGPFRPLPISLPPNFGTGR